MLYQPGRAVRVETAPVVSFDHTSPFARFYLMTLLTWPEDQKQQRYALATFAAQMIAYVEKKGVKAIAEEDFARSLKEVAAVMGLPPEAVLSMPLAREIGEAIIRDAGNMRGRLEEELLTPAGGFQALADAPGSKELSRVLDSTFDGPVRNVGYVLLLLARMEKQHAGLRPSLNRVFAVIEATCHPPLWDGVSTRLLAEHWAGWGSIAPLSAALWCWSDKRPPGASKLDWLTFAFTTTEGVKTVLRWAKWFRRFATTHQAKGSRSPLLSPATTLDYEVDLPEFVPMLHRLAPSEVQAAQIYRARTQKG